MTTIILGLGALTIVMGYISTVRGREIEVLREALETREQSLLEHYSYRAKQDKEKHLAEKENWKQTTNSWILEKEEMIERLTNRLFSRGKEHLEFKFESDKKIKELEREQFNQLHELALMLNDSYEVDKVILKKAELHDYLLHNANRRQRREFIEKGQFEL